MLDLIHVHMGIKKGLPEEVYKYVGDRYVQFAYEQTLWFVKFYITSLKNVDRTEQLEKG